MVTGEAGPHPLTCTPPTTTTTYTPALKTPGPPPPLFNQTFHSELSLIHHFCFSFPHLRVHRPPTPTSDPLQHLPLCLKQEMSPEVTSTSPSPNMAPNLAFVELQKPVSVSSSSSSCGSGSGPNHFPNHYNSFSHHAPVYGQFSSQNLMSGKAIIHLIHPRVPFVLHKPFKKATVSNIFVIFFKVNLVIYFF